MICTKGLYLSIIKLEKYAFKVFIKLMGAVDASVKHEQVSRTPLLRVSALQEMLATDARILLRCQSQSARKAAPMDAVI